MKREIINDLIKWKESKKRKPLIIHGARQVGKTYIVKQFGKEYYDNLIYVNFETNQELSSQISDSIDVKYVINKLELFYGEKIIPGKTLIFFDEIQANERALTSLKYFYEDAAEYHIIAAGSLLGIAINRKDYSFPVGKVQMMNMYPLSFKEFLVAIGRENLIDEIQIHFDNNERMDKTIHELCLKLYRTYLIVGGMPEVVQTYLTEEKTIAAIDVQAEILESYERDMTKYADSSLSNKIISAFDSIPLQLAKDNQKFQYKVISRGGTSGIFGDAILWLENSGIVNKVYKAVAELPLEMYKDLTSFKLYMSDVGLFVNKARYPLYQIDLSEQLTMISMGPLTEHYVANELRINGYKTYYWESNGKAELDFIIQKDTDIIPIEVKTSIHTKSRSLDLYMKTYNPKYAVRISEKNFGFENNIKSVPLYAVFCM
ncbi:MAG: ATP-binding protein [Clostridia bacterium]|nr:ATP-binding protein [Clostridia bacterium]